MSPRGHGYDSLAEEVRRAARQEADDNTPKIERFVVSHVKPVRLDSLQSDVQLKKGDLDFDRNSSIGKLKLGDELTVMRDEDGDRFVVGRRLREEQNEDEDDPDDGTARKAGDGLRIVNEKTWEIKPSDVRLDEWATPNSNVSMGGQKLRDLGNPTAGTDAARLLDLEAGAPPTGPAGGVLAGNYPSPGFAVDMATQAELDGGLAGKSNVGHGHAQSEITNLVSDLGLKAPLASPALTGNPTAPTPSAADSDTSIATTAMVQAAVSAGVSGAAISRLTQISPRSQQLGRRRMREVSLTPLTWRRSKTGSTSTPLRLTRLTGPTSPSEMPRSSRDTCVLAI